MVNRILITGSAGFIGYHLSKKLIETGFGLIGIDNLNSYYDVNLKNSRLLKLKELAYVHAEGYPAAEMKHGPIALIDENMPTIVIATNKINYDKIVSNIQEIKSRKGKIFAIVSKGDKEVKEIADHVIEVPDSTESITPFITVIPLQLLS